MFRFLRNTLPLRRYIQDTKVIGTDEGIIPAYDGNTSYIEGNFFDGYTYKGFWADGKIHSIGGYRYNDTKHGEVRHWHYNGKTARISNYDNDKLTGKSFQWDEDGKLEFVCNWKNNMLDGECRGWHKNGQLKYQYQYAEGMKSGLCTSWYDNGVKERESMYSKNLETGLYQSWYRDGNKRTKTTYTIVGGKKQLPDYSCLDGDYTAWYPGNILGATGKYVLDQRVGVHQEYYSNGQLYMEVSCKRGGFNSEVKQKFDEKGRDCKIGKGKITCYVPARVSNREGKEIDACIVLSVPEDVKRRDPIWWHGQSQGIVKYIAVVESGIVEKIVDFKGNEYYMATILNRINNATRDIYVPGDVIKPKKMDIDIDPMIKVFPYIDQCEEYMEYHKRVYEPPEHIFRLACVQLH